MKSKRLDLSGVCSFLSEHDNYLILTHGMPDGDTLGSAYALCSGLIKLGKKAKVVCPDPIPAHYGYFTNAVSFPEFSEETVISADVADIKLLGALAEKYEGKIELAIDHHASHRDFAKNLFLDGTAAACAECVYDILNTMHIAIDEIMVQAIYTGISTDTGCFKFSNTTPKTHVIAAELMASGIDFSEINRVMFDTKSKSRMEIEKMALGSVELLYRDRCALMAVTSKMLRDSGCTDADLDGITAIPRSIEGVQIGVTMRQKAPKVWKISMRSYPPFDVAAICAKMNGGGHKYAAGCEIVGTKRQAREEILKHVRKVLED
ncbi:MAG: bifunctional oligoribonuclease/PAP phosphatase NrnA [Clostridia bacterium]|nr:bifunctional oligoribonuclease/PAP phosphatase NrnA [Clostridia bacterium]